MKKILFVIYNFNTGGVPSSLESLYSVIKDKYDVDLFPIGWGGLHSFSFCEHLINSSLLLKMFASHGKDVRGLNKFLIGLFRPFKILLESLGFDLKSWVYRREVRLIELKTHYDCVISFQDRISAEFCCFFSKFPTIAWIHCDYPVLMGKKEDEKLFKNERKIICVSAFTANSFKDYYPNLASKVDYIYNVSDYQGIAEKAKCEIKDGHYKTDKFTIISLGRVSPEKRFDKIPSVAKKIKDMGFPFNWYIIGPGKGNYSQEVTDAIERECVMDCVHWIGGKANPYPYIKQANLFVSLSSTEACPMVFNEARIFGLPVVSTDFGSSYEFVDDGCDGMIRPIEKIHEAISALIGNKDTYNKFRQNSKCHLIDNEKIVKQFDVLLNSLS